ncbi:hypothetical protein [Luteolibacter marinus]|uniref:hypothetical protein n=1 Tax=Luteolibacter marinus TaxID=2776705 RepID=UPI001865A501|nr:hypothetical protein [Luteolibacter marinus]
MKTNISILFAALCLAITPTLRAEDDHHHHEKHEAGPNGGRVIDKVEPHFEFFVMPDKKLKLTFLGEDGKAVALKEQTVTAIGGERSKPTRFTFAKDGDALVSDKPLPEGKLVPIVLMVKMTPDAKTVTEKFNVNLAECPTCEHMEYACTCDH